MRGKLCDQDLTDYALNELQPEERLYLESMLAVSEECRNDIYEMIEVAQLLEEGFELEDSHVVDCELTAPQREVLLEFRSPFALWRPVAAAAALVTAAILVLNHPGFWPVDDPAGRVAQVSTQMSKIVAAAFNPEELSFATPLANIAAFAEDSSGWLPSAAEVLEPVMECTPPSWLERAQISSVGEM